MKKVTGTKKWIRLSVILYIVILSVAAVFTMAWFLFDETATIQTSDNMQITAGSKLEIAHIEKDGTVGDWGQQITLNTGSDVFPDITGDGNLFYYPKVLDDNDQAFETVDSFVDLSTVEDVGVFYITVHLRFRTTMPMTVYLSEDSFVKGKTDTLEGAEAENNSIFGDFSRDGIAGAVRVAFVEYNSQVADEYTLRNVWIPNDTYQLSYDQNETIGTNGDHKAYFTTGGEREYTTLEDGTKALNYGYLEKTTVNGEEKMVFKPWSEEQYVDQAVTLESQGLASEDQNGVQWIGGAAPLIEFKESDMKNGFAVRDLYIKIWIEGTDREADKAFTDGQLEYNFSFTGIEKGDFEKVNAEIAAKTIVSDGSKLYYKENDTLTEITETNLLLYSYNGVDWKPYNGQMVSDEEFQNSYVWVKYGEKIHVKASKGRYVAFENAG